MKKANQLVTPRSSSPRQDVKDFVNLIRQKSVHKTSNLLDHETFLRAFKGKETSDAELIEDYKLNHNELAFDELYRRYKSRMLVYLYGILGSWEDAKDVLHDSWEVTLKSFNNHRYSEKDDFAGWFKSICYRQASEWKRDKRRFLFGSGQLPDHSDLSFDAEQRLENNHSERLLENAVNRLPESERQVVILRIYQEMSFNEIAVARHLTVGAARGIYCRALKKLKNAIS